MIAKNLEHHEQRNCQEKTGDTPKPAPEKQGYKHYHRVDREASAHERRCDQIALQYCNRQERQCRIDRVHGNWKGQERGQQDSASCQDGAGIGNEIERRRHDAPKQCIG